MQHLLYVVLIVVISIVGVIVFLFFSSLAKQITVDDHIKELELFFGESNLIKDYQIIEYNFKQYHGDRPLSLVIKLNSENYQIIVDLISNPKYKNRNMEVLEFSKLWTLGPTGFNFNSKSCKNVGQRQVVEISGIDKELIIKYRSFSV